MLKKIQKSLLIGVDDFDVTSRSWGGSSDLQKLKEFSIISIFTNLDFLLGSLPVASMHVGMYLCLLYPSHFSLLLSKLAKLILLVYY